MSLFTSTGETFPNQMIDDLRTCFPDARVQPMYGLTECKRVSILEANPPDTQRFSVGKPLPGTRAWVGDELGKPLAIGQVGELYVQGPHLMEGYWKRPDITAKRMITVDGVRTLRTGDHFSVNENGYLQFVSRGAGFLKSMGMRISPADVEQVLMALPGVVAALAVDFVDPKLGDRVAAIVQINNDQSENKLIELCRKMLPPAAVPVRIVLQREPLQLSVNGKYNRRALADYVRAQLGSSEG
jgi:acyl-CoA synthetase (AMP-forming)/AMP-acid ligase II